MDAPEDRDFLLQRASADLLIDLKEALPKLLYKKTVSSDRGALSRQTVRITAAERLIKMVW